MLLYIHLSNWININRLHYVLRKSAEGILNLEQSTESKSLTTYDLGGEGNLYYSCI